jgi:hypothetical protein
VNKTFQLNWKEHMTKSSQLLLELPATISQMINKRGRVLRDGGSRGVSPLLAGQSSAWISTEAATTSDANPWDLAHEVAGKLRKELGTSVYVEPAASGRFHKMISPEAPAEANQDAFHASAAPSRHSSTAISVNQPGLGVQHTGLGRGLGMGIGGMGAHMPGKRGPGPGTAMYPSRHGIEPVTNTTMHGREGSRKHANNGDLSFPALRSANSFKALPAASQMMFEVEAAQVMNASAPQPAQPALAIDDQSTLMLLAFQPGISKSLRAVLEKAIGLESLK